MSFLIKLLESFKENKDRVFVEQNNEVYTYGEIYSLAVELKRVLEDKFNNKKNSPIVGLVIKNSVDWVVADLACMISGFTILPFPLSFSKEQANYLLTQCNNFIVDDFGKEVLESDWGVKFDSDVSINLTEINYVGIDVEVDLNVKQDINFISKIIHTSGTTSNPKGVKISLDGLMETLTSLDKLIPKDKFSSYLSLVPLSLLLEQITGIYLPCIRGGKIIFLPKEVPHLGEKNVNINNLLDFIFNIKPSALTVPPIILDSILKIIKQPNHPDLIKILYYINQNPYITCGGSSISTKTLEKLQQFGLNVYQGYGLSENTSVVTMNTPLQQRIGSVGKPLPHVNLRVSKAGEIQISGKSIFSGYTGLDPSKCDFTEDNWLDTGDLGYIDNDGFLYISGRKKNIICLSNGRNVSPEQVEIALNTHSEVLSTTVILNKNNKLSALVVYNENLNAFDLKDWSKERISEIECPTEFIMIKKGDPILKNLFTVTGRPKRDEINKYLELKA